VEERQETGQRAGRQEGDAEGDSEGDIRSLLDGLADSLGEDVAGAAVTRGAVVAAGELQAVTAASRARARSSRV